DQQLSLRGLKEGCKALSRVDWTDHQLVAVRGEGLALDVGVKELGSFVYNIAVLGHDTEGAAPCVQVGKVVGEQIEFFAINQHHLAVVARQIIGRARNSDAFFQ